MKKTIDCNQIAALYEAEPTETVAVKIGDEEIEIEVKKRLSLENRSRFVDAIASQCFVTVDENENKVEYVPYMRTPAINLAFIEFFTNINIPEGTAIDVLGNLATNYKLIEDLEKASDKNYINELVCDADELIDFKCKKLEHERESKFDKLIVAFTDLLKGLEDSFKGMEPEEIMNAMKEFGSQDIG